MQGIGGGGLGGGGVCKASLNFDTPYQVGVQVCGPALCTIQVIVKNVKAATAQAKKLLLLQKMHAQFVIRHRARPAQDDIECCSN